jgi:hypothetical protein
LILYLINFIDMPTTTEYGPFIVSTARIDTGIFIESGNVVRTISTGLLDLGGAFLGLGQVIRNADGDDRQPPSDYPAPELRKNSLIFQAGGRWYQGGTNIAMECTTNGFLTLYVNDNNPSDNSGGWEVRVQVIWAEPSPFLYCRIRFNTDSGAFGNFQSEGWTENYRGRYMHYEGASLYWSPETDCHEVHGDIRVLYAALGWERSYLGYPVTDESSTPDGIGRFNHFEGGAIYWAPQTHAHAVKRYIRDRWAELHYTNGYLGYPISDTLHECGGEYNAFQGGVIYGGIDIPNNINILYHQFGGHCGSLGYPQAKYFLSLYSGYKFEFRNNKMMYWSERTGAHIVKDTILFHYERNGEQSGSWGYPIEEETAQSQRFEHGTAYYNVFQGTFEFRTTSPPPSSGALTVSLGGNVPIFYNEVGTHLALISPSGSRIVKTFNISGSTSLTRSETSEAGNWQLICSLVFQIPIWDSVDAGGTSTFSNDGSPKTVFFNPFGGDSVFRFVFEYTPAILMESSRKRFID